jgi:hypothetical protein
MLPFTAEELAFLSRHGISPDNVHDGRYQSKPVWQAEAQRAGKMFVLGARCRKRGHRIRTRAGHCAQCNPANIAYQRRWRAPAYVYVAGSLSAGLLKVGVSENINQREDMLRRGHKYGSITDWEILAHIEVEEGGRVEHDTLTKLRRYRVFEPYDKDGVVQVGIELIRCSLSRVLNALLTTISDDETSTLWKWSRSHEYEFDEDDALEEGR